MSILVDLNRLFTVAPEDGDFRKLAEDSYLLEDSGNDGLTWQELLSKKIVVILGELGSGKTKELEIQHNKLSAHKKFSFKVDLYSLVGNSLETSLGSKQYDEFLRWKKSAEHGYIFLDSVDESKIARPDDFFLAISRLGDTVGSEQLERATIILTSRISEWRPKTDAQKLKDTFLLAPTVNLNPFQSNKSNIKNARNIEPFIVHIKALSLDQVRLYAKSEEVENINEFIEAIQKQNAWELARRPVDVSELISYWKAHGKLGSLYELLKGRIIASTKDPENREKQNPLSPERALDGLQSLGAAAVFCKNLHFRIPDDNISNNSLALNPSDCLMPNWVGKEKRALLDRPLFDTAFFGTIKFHHRRILELLAADWLQERLNDGLTLDKLVTLLTYSFEGRLVLKSHLAPVAAWLCIGDTTFNQRIREVILDCAPDIHFSYGDPSKLSTDYRRELLLKIDKLYKNGQINRINYDPAILSRIADSNLCDSISELLQSPQTESRFISELLLVVKFGSLRECLPSVLKIFSDSDTTETNRILAIQCFEANSDTNYLAQLKHEALLLPPFPHSVLTELIECLYPDNLSSHELKTLILNSTAPNRYSTGASWRLKKHFSAVSDKLDFIQLISILIEIMEFVPEDTTYDLDEEERREWLAQLLIIALDKAVKSKTASVENLVIVNALHLLDNLMNHGLHFTDENLVSNFKKTLNANAEIKEQAFITGVELHRITLGEPKENLWRISRLWRFIQFDSNDIEWLVSFCEKNNNFKDVQVAHRLALELWVPSLSFKLIRLLKLSGKTQIPLLECLQLSLPNIFRNFSVHWRMNWKYKLEGGEWKKYIKRRYEKFTNGILDRYYLYTGLRSIYTGKNQHFISHLLHEVSFQEKTSRWAINDWSYLEKKRGKLIAWATRRGAEKSWNKVMPLLPAQLIPHSTPQSIITGLCGLQSLVVRKKITFSDISAEDSLRVCRYSLNEMNGFPDWLNSFIEARPEIFVQEFSNSMELEWLFDETNISNSVIQKLLWGGREHWPLIRQNLLIKLQELDPVSSQILDATISILIQRESPVINSVKALCTSRLNIYEPEDNRCKIWLGLFFQVDPLSAMKYSDEKIKKIPERANEWIVGILGNLGGNRFKSALVLPEPQYFDPRFWANFVIFVYKYVNPKEDINRTGAYSPGDRDHAQDFRYGLIDKFSQLQGPNILEQLRKVVISPDLEPHKHWLQEVIQKQIKIIADASEFVPSQVIELRKENEFSPRNAEQLFNLVHSRLLDIKYNVELPDGSSIRNQAHTKWIEADFRKWFHTKLTETSRHRYIATQEAEVDPGKNPDLRFDYPKLIGCCLELKVAESWPLHVLLERLENQLMKQYMRAHDIRLGFFLMVHNVDHSWENPQGGKRLEYIEILERLSIRAIELTKANPDIDRIEVISVDFRDPNK
ncbi:hypothetical protein A7981_11350 [Methylovorus sp. MM2]|uniref:hypothetical protein n=1 Tax=Methylovorus sp. MM2 TaxID=1848038 RepID=UPI0007E135F7|nr:hypothetical protein [Methylovorus sp. MM2]OAM51314.1 hypothetical protein A7981_11350 [Methylovorus sp. MM2]